MKIFDLSRHAYRWAVVMIVLVAAALYLYRLGDVPHGMTWDEAAIGYNGFAIVTTRRDEWLTRLPISFWSFGDYKAPLAIYLNGFFTFAFGLNLWAVRLPFALAGVGAVLGMIYLTRLLLVREKTAPSRARFLAVMAGVTMAITPWHHHFARIGFESGIALCFFIWAVYFFFQSLTVAARKRQWIDAILSSLLFSASIYTYHSAKITVPLVLLFLALAFRKEMARPLQPYLAAVLMGVVTLVPFLRDSLFGKGLERAGTLVFSQGYSASQTAAVIFNNVWVQFSPAFLAGGWTTNLRHGDGMWGVLLPMTCISAVAAVWCALRRKETRTPVFWLGVMMVLFGSLPAVLGEEVPHSNRALLALPGFLLLAVAGWQGILASHWSWEWKKITLGMIVLLETLFFASYLHHYYTRFAAQSATDFQDGYVDAFRFVLPYERGEAGYKEAEKIIFTSRYGQPYIYALFTRKTNPIWYHGGSLVKYEFKDVITVGDLERPNTVVVASNTDELFGWSDRADTVIYGSDGLPRFRIFVPQ